MKQDELLKKIRKSAESVPTPQNLEPHQMMKRLDDLPDSKKGKGKSQNKMRMLQYGTTAVLAVSSFMLLVNLGFFDTGSKMPNKSVMPFSQPAQQEMEAASEETKASGVKGQAGENSETSHAAGRKYAAASYEEIYQVIQKGMEQQKYDVEENYDGWAGGNTASFETTAAASEDMVSGSNDMGSTPTETNKDDFSDTNVQTEGVDEGDVVKTDGTYLYITSQGRSAIQIVKADGVSMELVGQMKDGSDNISEFYIYENKLSIIKEKYDRETDKYKTWLETYDVTNPSSPKLTGSIVQDGFYKSSRRVDEHIYLFTSFQVNTEASKEETEQYIPGINGKQIPYECIYIPEQPEIHHYLVASSIDLEEPGKVKDLKALMADGDNFYVSRENIYSASKQYDYRANQYDYTELFKFSYHDGFISYQAHGLIDGYLNNQFSMDEYQGNLRLVTTLSRQNGKSTNSLLILDSDLNKLGSIKNLAPDEQIYSARFLGDTGYFVTFRNMDPLFSVDLSDPSNPRVLGELKITGFSEYLHFFTDNLLLGIGKEINPDTQNFEGLKLSMFDISNPSDVKEVNKIVEQSYQSTPAFTEYKSVLISSSKNLTGFSVERYDYNTRQWSLAYVVYSYDKEQGFEKVMECELDNNEDYWMIRGIYIGDYLYIVSSSQILSYHLGSFERVGQLNY